MKQDYIVLGRTNATAKNGSKYATLKVAAKKGEAVSLQVWNIEETDGPAIGDIINFDMELVKQQKFPSKADFGFFKSCRPATENDELFNIIGHPISKSKWDECISNLLRLCNDQALMGFIRDEAYDLYDAYKDKTGAASMHHAYKGGLLNHTYELLHMLEGLYPTLPPLKIERCIIAILFHDFGKMREYDQETFEPTKYMFLMGHIYISAHILHNKLNEAKIDPVETNFIVHCVLAHHGTREFGSPVLPCTAEALVVNQLDLMSAKLTNIDDTANMEKSISLGTTVVK